MLAHGYADMALSVYTKILECGDTFYMNGRFCELTDYARQTIPDDLRFEEEWMLSPSGFLWIETPFTVPEPQIPEKEYQHGVIKRAGGVRISAVGWQRVPDHVLSLFRDHLPSA